MQYTEKDMVSEDNKTLQFFIRPFTESEMQEVVEDAGGIVAHKNPDRRQHKGADFVFHDAVIELKFLNEDGFQKENRQQKLAKLFIEEGFNSPVVVLDRGVLSPKGRRVYDRIIEGPISTAVSSARKQLKQTRREQSDTMLSVLWIINNGYTALNHDDLIRLLSHRVRNDSETIDGVVVGGCYFHSDGFDGLFLWPFSYVPIRLVEWTGFKLLHDAWNRFAENYMSRVVRGELGEKLTKGPVADSEFDIEDRTFVKPAPPIGANSEFYPRGRPRRNSTGINTCPPVGLTFPGLPLSEWEKVRSALPEHFELGKNYEDWLKQEESGRAEGTALRPFVSVPITFSGLQSWCSSEDLELTPGLIWGYANKIFQDQVRLMMAKALEMREDSLIPTRYVLAVTDEIGQDKANDLSQISLVYNRISGDSHDQLIAKDLRIFHEYALALACSYAVSEGIDTVRWIRRKKYVWS